MRCPSCRNIIEKNDLYCSSCGYYIPAYKNAKIHPYAKKSNLPFISFLTAFMSLICSYTVSYYFFILAIIGFMLGFYSLLRYRRGVLGIVFNVFAMAFDIILILYPDLFIVEEPSIPVTDYFAPFYGTYECSSDKVHKDLYIELNKDYTFKYLEDEKDHNTYAYGNYTFLNQTKDIEKAATFTFQIFLKAPSKQHVVNDIISNDVFYRDFIFNVYESHQIAKGNIVFSSNSILYFCEKTF